jgi:hypothetical protein
MPLYNWIEKKEPEMAKVMLQDICTYLYPQKIFSFLVIHPLRIDSFAITGKVII